MQRQSFTPDGRGARDGAQAGLFKSPGAETMTQVRFCRFAASAIAALLVFAPLPANRISTFTIQNLTYAKVAFCGCHRVSIETPRDSSRLATQPDRGDRDTKLEPDKVPAFIETHVTTARVGDDLILLKAMANVICVSFD